MLQLGYLICLHTNTPVCFSTFHLLLKKSCKRSYSEATSGAKGVAYGLRDKMVKDHGNMGTVHYHNEVKKRLSGLHLTDSATATGWLFLSRSKPAINLPDRSYGPTTSTHEHYLVRRKTMCYWISDLVCEESSLCCCHYG